MGHSICLMAFTVIYFVGLGEEIYYNMGFAIMLGIVCLIFNIQEAANKFAVLTKSDGEAMFYGILNSASTYGLLLEGVYLFVAVCSGFKKYEQFRSETYALIAEQQ